MIMIMIQVLLLIAMIKSLFVMKTSVMMFMVMMMKLMIIMEDACHVQNAFIQDGKRHGRPGLASNLDAAWLLVTSEFEASPRGLIHVKGKINNCVLLIQT